MPNALTRPVRPPRRLPSDDSLSAEDYRRLIGVIEAVDRAADLPQFRACLVRALQDWFGFRGVAVLHGDTLTDAADNGCGIMDGIRRRVPRRVRGQVGRRRPLQGRGLFPADAAGGRGPAE